MAKKWYSILDSVKFSIAILLIGSLLTGIGNIQVEGELLQNTLEMIAFLGKEIKDVFPLAIVLNYIGKTHKDVIAVIGGIICYVVFNVVTMFVSSTSYNAAYYYNVMGIEHNGLQPLNIGILASMIVIVIILVTYKISRSRFNYGFLTFIDNDVWFFIIALLLTVLCGVGVCAIAPRFIAFFQRGLRFISKNNTNPALLFVYGIVDKGLEMFGIDNITKQQFLFDNLGGSWVNGQEAIVLGDVNIWTAQIETGTVGKAVGKFITPSYIVNVFAIPSLVLAYYLNITDKMDKKRTGGLVLVGILASILTGSSLPVEYVLLFTAPLLFVIHLLLTGSAYMLMSMQGIFLGYHYSGPVSSMCMGNVFDLIGFINNVDFHNMALRLVVIGVGYFVVYQIITFIYYRVLSNEFLEPQIRKNEIKDIIGALGGLHNIKMITSSILSITVVLNNKEDINVERLVENKAFKVKERYFGFIISFGPSSASICHHIRKELKNYKDCLMFSNK